MRIDISPRRLDGRVDLVATGAAAPDVVWERYARPSRWQTWSPQIRRVDTDALGDRIAVGVTGRVHSYAPAAVRFEVVAVDELAMTWSWSASLGPVTLHLDHAVSAYESGSRTELGMRGPAPVLLGYAPLAQLALRRLVAA